MKAHERSGGFTLIELVIAVTIIGILAAIAYPNFRDYVTQTRRTDAQVTLTRTAATLEKFFTNCSRYPTAAEYAAARSADCANAGLGGPATSQDAYYALVYVQGGPGCGAGQPVSSCYQLTANPVGNQAAGEGNLAPTKRCTVFTLDHRGVKGAKDGNSNDAKDRCWKK